MDFDLLRIVVLATFVSQLVTVSVIAPRRVYLWRCDLWEKYPPEQYPRLYPIGTARVKRQQSIANVIDGVVFCAGALLFITLLIRSTPTAQVANFATDVMMVQILVRLPRQIIDFQIIRAYKSAQPPTVRSATFKSWALWDFVPPALVVCGIASVTLAVIIATLVALSQQELNVRTLILLSMDLFLLFRMIRVIYRPLLPRLDPYATNDDVYVARRRRLRVLYVGSAIFASVTTIELLASARLIEIRSEYIVIGLSVLFQTMMLLISTVLIRQLRNRDFNAYREARPTTTRELA